MSAPPFNPHDELARRLKESATVVGRAAHDFDNVLQGVIGFTELALQAIPINSPVALYLNELAKAGQRGLDLTRQLHQLSRGGQPHPHPPADVVTVLAGEKQRWPEKPVPVRTMASADLPRVAIAHDSLSQALGHLTANAVEASEAGDEVAVEARLVELTADDAAAFLGAVRPGSAVEMVIRDHGKGIAPELANRLFVEPFLTTKVRHRGLGLAIVYRILHTHAGGVRLESPQDGGTRAVMVVPVASAVTGNR